ncbi:YidB family protein [Cupriavidus neocaledonicus]|uniref:DUF937 domain-containing protein n=1 Tax=Cupriavidus neocaledonicus TaxID=1040979 RepID=A0ABY1V018_9BURK|nr:YidB family protein [Cupriavidus neocaledonicus]SOZ36016.1 conserved hypothetical protein, DUF937 [Cupriavidus neocaledonicus]
MGLVDSVLGGVLGQLGGARAENGQAGGLDPKLMMALGLLATLAMRRRAQGSDAAGDAPAADDGLGGLGSLGGLLGGMLGGGAGTAPGGATGGLDLGSLLGGLLGGQGGAPANSQALGAAAGGIGALQQILAQAGLGEQVDSWISSGPNQPVTPSALSDALNDTGALQSLAQSTGMSQDDVAAQLSEGLPELIDRLTPHGHVPAQE